MSAVAQTPPRSPWIVSPRVDGLFIVGAVVLCPAVILPLAHLASPRSVWLAVMAFGAVGHHFPSFLRTYGDRELFRRFRARFLLAPPLIFVLAVAFDRFGLHGVVLLSFAASIWHGMMQHFGFLRIYDSRSGAVDAKSSCMDWWLSAAWFAMSIAFGPDEARALLDTMYSTHVPLLSTGAVAGARVALLVATVAITAVYVRHAATRTPRPGVPKLALLIGTCVYVWIVRIWTHDPYLSIACFELLHDVQYLVIVRAVNRSLVQKGSGGRVAKALYGAGAGAIGLYLLACLAYGSIALLPSLDLVGGAWKALLQAALVTSGLTHFYYDGFIWKLGDARNRRQLGLQEQTGSPAPIGPTSRPIPRGAWHVAILAGFLALAVGVERMLPAADPLSRAQALAAVVPGNPTARAALGDELLGAGRADDAIPELRAALELQPQLDATRGRLAGALAERAGRREREGRVDDAVADLREAILLEPSTPALHRALAATFDRAGRVADADLERRAAVAIASH